VRLCHEGATHRMCNLFEAGHILEKMALGFVH
jgi:hypothetical protein